MVDEALEERQIVESDRAGFDMTTHVIGDLALRRTLDWYEAAIRANGPRADRRQRIIHVWYAHPDDLARAGRMGLVADVQPSMLVERHEAVARALGPERARWAHAYRTMIDAGMRLVLSSDFPGTVNRLSFASYNPLENMYMAVTRQDVHGQPRAVGIPSSASPSTRRSAPTRSTPPGLPTRRRSRAASRQASSRTWWCCRRTFRSIPPQDLLKTEVRYTIVGGRIVHGD
jgi:predicted amidohydrolase YtcJ